ncbi:helix-turn-helix domain-containing protein [Methylophilaceae bacterium]|nr:helix-turn-helix domain-containing protein [Methylophilaceae bacterium]
MKDSFLNIDDITNSLKIDKDTLKKWIKDGKFPPAKKIGDRTTLWSYAVIENWVAQQQKTQEFIDNQDLDL